MNQITATSFVSLVICRRAFQLLLLLTCSVACKAQPIDSIGDLRFEKFGLQSSDKFKYSTEISNHAQQQLEQMLGDRPGMAGTISKDGAIFLLTKESPLWSFALSVFSGKFTGIPVFWHSAQPENSADGNYSTPQAHGLLMIRVKDHSGEGLGAFDQMWSTFVFEALNSTNAPAWYRRARLVRTSVSLISRNEFVKESSRDEWKAMRILFQLYTNIFQPWFQHHNVETNATEWGDGVMSDFEQWFAQYNDQSNYPWIPYGVYYDSAVNSME